MKKTLKFIGFTTLFIVALLFATPFFLKKPIVERINTEIEKNIKGKLQYKDVDLSFFSHFPQITIKLNDIVLTGIESFEYDTLFVAKETGVSIDIWKTWKNDNLHINTINIENGTLNTIIDKTGKENWDIIRKDKNNNIEKKDTTTKNSSEKGLLFNKVVLENLTLKYTNKLDKQFVSTHIKDASIKGKLSNENDLTLDFEGKLTDNYVKLENKVLIDKIPLTCETSIQGNLDKMEFHITDGVFAIKNLPLNLTGNFALLNDGYLTDLELKTQKSDIETLLSLIPKEFLKSIKDIDSKGQFSLTAAIKGKYTDKEYPAVNMKATISNGFIKFPNQNESIKDINLNGELSNYGKGLKHFKLVMPTASLMIANNPLNASLYANNITQSPQIKGTIKSKINLTELKNVFPMKDMDVMGILDMDVAFDGNLSDIEKEQYEKFKTSGYVKLNNFNFSSKDFNKDIAIKNATFDFKTKYIELKESLIDIGKTQIALKGRIANYIQYLTKGKTLTGNFFLNSSLVNIAELASSSTSKPSKQVEKQEKTETPEVLEVPENLNISLDCNIKRLIYGVTDLRNIIGNIKVAQGQIKLNNLNLKMADGDIKLSGGYIPKEKNLNAPFINLRTNINTISLPELLKQMPVLKNSLPIGTNTKGSVSTQLKFETQLDNTMYPLRKTGNGEGGITITNLILTNNNLTKNLVLLTGNQELSRILISNLTVNYTVKNGDITIAPFETSLAGRKTQGHGTLFSDNTLDFSLQLELTAKDLNGKIGQQIKKIPGLSNIDSFPVALKITGTPEKPIVTPDLKSMINNIFGNKKSNIFEGFAKKLFGGSKKDTTKN